MKDSGEERRGGGGEGGGRGGEGEGRGSGREGRGRSRSRNWGYQSKPRELGEKGGGEFTVNWGPEGGIDRHIYVSGVTPCLQVVWGGGGYVSECVCMCFGRHIPRGSPV